MVVNALIERVRIQFHRFREDDNAVSHLRLRDTEVHS